MWSGGRLLLLGFGGLGLEWGRGLGMSSTTSSSASTRTVTSSNPAVHIPTPTPTSTTTTTNSYYSNTRNFHHRHHLFQFQFQFQFHTTPTPTTTDYSCRTTSPRSSTPSLLPVTCSSSAGTNTTTGEDGDDPSNNNQINTASFVFTNEDGRKKNASTAAAEAVVSGTTARGRRLLKVREEKRTREHDRLHNYPSWAKVLEDACQHDEELRAVLGDSVGNPELMRQRVEDRVRGKGRNFHKSKTGSVLAFKVSFRDFNLVDSFIWFELYGSPSDRDVDLIGSVIQSWYVMGRLGAFNSSNLQLANSSMEYNPLYDVDKGFKVIPSSFHDISDIEFQDNWGRVWVDLGTCDFFAIDVLLNCLTVLSSEYLGIQQVVFGGRRMGDWEEGMTNTEYGYKYFKI